MENNSQYEESVHVESDKGYVRLVHPYNEALNKNKSLLEHLRQANIGGGNLYEFFASALKRCEVQINSSEFKGNMDAALNNGIVERLHNEIARLSDRSVHRNSQDLLGRLAGEIWGVLDWLETNSWGERRDEVSAAKIEFYNAVNSMREVSVRDSFHRKVIDRLSVEKKAESIVEMNSIVNNKIQSAMEAMQSTVQKNMTEAEEKSEKVLEKLRIAEERASFTYLYAGFDSLKINLQNALEDSNGKLFLYKIFAVLLPLAIAFLAFVDLLWLPEPLSWKNRLLISVPMASIEILLVYFFRIELSRAKNLEEMVWQTENKSAAIAYYAAYSGSEEMSDNSDLFRKFNDFVFNPVKGSEWNPPNVTDGLSEIAKILRAK